MKRFLELTETKFESFLKNKLLDFESMVLN
jgi:hypothetical protein